MFACEGSISSSSSFSSFPDPSSMNAQFEFSGDRREVDVGLSDVEKKVLQREETMMEDEFSQAETTLLSAGQPSSDQTIDTWHRLQMGVVRFARIIIICNFKI